MNQNIDPKLVICRSFIDQQPLWSGKYSTDQEISDAIKSAKQTQQQWKSVTCEERIAVVRRYAKELESRSDEIAKLITAETGKLHSDAQAEVRAATAKVELTIDAFTGRRSGTSIQSTKPADGQQVTKRIRYSPLGVAVVLGPFNFPLHLPGGHIIPAILAGNAVIFKPSEKAIATGHWMTEAWRRSGLPLGCLQIIIGDGQTAAKAIESDSISAVFLTGSRAAGQAVHRSLAGRPEVLLALELGGNNPIVVTPDVEPHSASEIVTFSAFASSGQRCTCARRAILTEGPRTEELINEIIQQTRGLKAAMPNQAQPPHLGPLIDSLATERLLKQYQSLLELGCKPILAPTRSSDDNRLMGPSIVDGSSLEANQRKQLGEMEWFGPMLVIQKASDLDDAFELASDSPYGLSASLVGGTEEDFSAFCEVVGAGVINWNAPTTGAAGVLPFGGRGWSGNHRPAGFFAIDSCNEPIASNEQSTVPNVSLWSDA